MSSDLTNQEKIEIINNHVKNLNAGKYNLELSLAEENSIDNPSQEKVSLLTQEIADTVKRIEAIELLKNEL